MNTETNNNIIEQENMNIEEQQENQNQEQQEHQQETVEMQTSDEENKEEENKEQEILDNKILEELKKINEDYNTIVDRIVIIKKILKEDFNDLDNNSNIGEKKQSSRYLKKSFMENEIKLEKLLLRLDSLVGASEKIRPEKKKLVSTVQNSIVEIEEILKKEIKEIESKIEQQETLRRKEMEEERKSHEELEKQYKIEDQKVNQTKEESKMSDSDSDSEMETKETQHESPKQHETPKQQETKVEKVVDSDEEKKVEEKKEDNKTFPLPSREDWEKLTFDPEFDVKQTQDKYIVFSKISNLNIKDLTLKTSDNKITIEGVKYPTKEEENLLVKKLMMSLRNPYQLKNYPRNQIISTILKIASQYDFGRFSVTYRLPPNLDSSQEIAATYQNGILRVDLPTKRKVYSPFNQNSYRSEVPYYNQRNRRNLFWDY